MAHDKSTTEHHSDAGGNRRFRLPKLFADSDDTAPGTEETAERIAQRANALGVTLPAPVAEDIIVAANRPYEGAPRAAVLRMSPEEAAAEMKAEAAAAAPEARNVTANASANATAAPGKIDQDKVSQAHATQTDITQTDSAQTDSAHIETTAAMTAPSAVHKPTDADDAPPLSGTTQDIVSLGVASPTISTTPVNSITPVASTTLTASAKPVELPIGPQRVLERVLETDPHMMQKLTNLEERMESMNRLLQEICDRGTAQEKVFDTLHSELQDYKNDFIYEHLKPVVRPLLFLYDSLEQFEDELAQQERPQVDERRRGLSPALVRQNMAFFREQLVEALHICEVTPMQTPEGVFDPKCHKAVDIALVEPEQENHIQRVVRSGWYLNGHVFRPAEVVVGKTTAEYNAQIWNYGHGKNGDKPASATPASTQAVGGDA
ncbi:MAG TPA: nucleotide exchange factor GrpE [Abditibacteriaceae bacterium]|jgi:molecular chaperone GrpE (heat shock protein)